MSDVRDPFPQLLRAPMKPSHASAIQQAKEDRIRREFIQAKYEASKTGASLSPGGAVDARGPGSAGSEAPALPSLRCKLCDVRSSYPRLCKGCTEVR